MNDLIQIAYSIASSMRAIAAALVCMALIMLLDWYGRSKRLWRRRRK